MRIISWNLGYAGLGKNNSFFFDGKGEGRILPVSKKDVISSLDNQIKFLIKSDPDIILLQEVTSSSIINYKVPMLDIILHRMKKYKYSYFHPTTDIFFSKIVHGDLVLSKKEFKCNLVNLPMEAKGLSKLIKQKYAAIVCDFLLNNKHISIINTHLSAFDPNSTTRHDQLLTLIDNINSKQPTIIGGDFNMSPVSLNLFTNQNHYSFWVSNISNAILDQLKNRGMKILFDSSSPTVRTNEKPYDKTNYKTITDFFIYSKKFKINIVKTYDLDFLYSDHNPILLSFEI
jgi:endonuclease/exonuclease/phosphatase family metal-dependent hydrolase